MPLGPSTNDGGFHKFLQWTECLVLLVRVSHILKFITCLEGTRVRNMEGLNVRRTCLIVTCSMSVEVRMGANNQYDSVLDCRPGCVDSLILKQRFRFVTWIIPPKVQSLYYNLPLMVWGILCVSKKTWSEDTSVTYTSILTRLASGPGSSEVMPEPFLF